MAASTTSPFFLAHPTAGFVVPNSTRAAVLPRQTVSKRHFTANGKQEQDGEEQVSFHDEDSLEICLLTFEVEISCLL
ncbi:unnamed protein product [Callosobruchus maculatus]|uniref:Uncharacterized protein n=1 Tax=Callosobruchus maculatus TaxID=64391 RepID=A0A653C8A5_CALMS|nr:unnamed protein product [Callosobruchus maculatus]